MKRMVISRRLNALEGRHADSWARVIGGRLFLFIHGHSPTAGGNTRARMTTRSLTVYEIEWEDFADLAEVARFTHSQRREGSALRHRWAH
ncbi:hypothetical protein [Streptomyces sp. RK31]|uniref:hypothetical protein n=1 Tax=Streptomyces sp. RK31 TaxID=2824892 RepID=UPI001B387EED|nr:hypothetical protein [Streptomyces sp. RK31]